MAHWYTADGTACHYQKTKDGKTRDTDLRDARQLNLFPSVSDVIKTKAKGFFLERYKQQQILDASWHIAKRGTYDTWSKKVLERSVEHRDGAADFGSKVHQCLEDLQNNHTGDAVDVDPLVQDISAYAFEFLCSEFDMETMISEKTFTNVHHGYGGTCDLHDPTNFIILDYKTKDKETVQKQSAYESNHMQLAAYAMGLLPHCGKLDCGQIPKLYNLFISRTPGDFKLVESKEFDRYWFMFYHLLEVWKLDKNYFPKKI